MALLCIVFSLGIWIYYFDNEGPEAGTTTIFGSVFLWPVFLLLIVFGGIVGAASRWLFVALLTVTVILFAWVLPLTLITRAENQRQWQEQQDAARQKLMLVPAPGAAQLAEGVRGSTPNATL